MKRGKSYVMPECKQCEIERSTQWNKNNRIRTNHYKKKWRKKNPDKIKKYMRKWRDKNHEIDKIHQRNNQHKRRAIKRKTSVGPVPSRDFILKQQGGVCNYCKIEGDEVEWHLDHVIPLSRGGSHTEDNVQVLCRSCNQSKGNKLPDEI